MSNLFLPRPRTEKRKSDRSNKIQAVQDFAILVKDAQNSLDNWSLFAGKIVEFLREDPSLFEPILRAGSPKLWSALTEQRTPSVSTTSSGSNPLEENLSADKEIMRRKRKREKEKARRARQKQRLEEAAKEKGAEISFSASPSRSPTPILSVEI